MDHNSLNNLRVIHVLDHSLPTQSGYSFRTLSILRGQRDLGWTTMQLTTPRHLAGGPNPESIDGFSFFRAGSVSGIASRIFGLRELIEIRRTERALRRLCQWFRPTLLHAHSPILAGIPAIRTGRRFGIPVVYEVRAFWEDAAVSEGATTEGSPRYALTRSIETRVLQQSQAITVICDGLRSEILGRGIHPAKVSVVPNSVDIGRFPLLAGRDVELARQIGVDKSLVLGFIGSFYRYEGLPLLIDGLSEIRKYHPTTRVLLIGSGPDEGEIRRRVQQLGMTDAVTILSRVPHDQVQRFYSLVDICIYPRLRDRITDLVTPLKPLESMALGRLVIASNVGGHVELIRDGDTGFLFEANDMTALVAAVRRVISLQERWPEIARRARNYVEQERSWARTVGIYRDVYASVTDAST